MVLLTDKAHAKRIEGTRTQLCKCLLSARHRIEVVELELDVEPLRRLLPVHAMTEYGIDAALHAVAEQQSGAIGKGVHVLLATALSESSAVGVSCLVVVDAKPAPSGHAVLRLSHL